jgi:hypothetical protein
MVGVSCLSSFWFQDAPCLWPHSTKETWTSNKSNVSPSAETDRVAPASGQSLLGILQVIKPCTACTNHIQNAMSYCKVTKFPQKANTSCRQIKGQITLLSQGVHPPRIHFWWAHHKQVHAQEHLQFLQAADPLTGTPVSTHCAKTEHFHKNLITQNKNKSI